MVSLRALRRAMAAAPAAPPPPADAARPLRVGLLYDERMCAHETPDGEEHPENPERLRAIWRKLNAEGITSRCVLLKAKEAEDRYIASVHSQDHINLMKEISSKQYNSRRNKIAKKYNSIYFNQGSSESAVLAAGSVIEVAEKVAAGELTSAIALVRPPGHHAEHDKAMGFCLFNNVAVAANYLLNERPDLGIKKILIVDWDVHHGNATQKMFYDDPRVLVFSVHRFDFGDFYPYEADASYCFIGEEAGKGYNINVPWEQGKCGDADYIATWDHILLPVTEAFDPDIILVSAGFDAALGDPLGGCCITPNGYARLLTKLLGFAQGRIVMTLEGGYNLRSTANSVFACAKVLLGDKFTFNSSGKQPFESTWRVIQEVRNELKTCWPVFSDKLQERPVMEGRTAGPSMTKSVPDLDAAEAAAGLNAQDVIVSPANEGEVAPGFGPLPNMQVPCPDDAAPLLEGEGGAAERILTLGDIIATTNAGAAADSTAPSGREVVEGRGAPVNVDAGERGGDRGTLGLDRPGVPAEFVSAVEDENRLWLEHHQLGTSIQNALFSVLELHQNRGLQLHEKLRDMAGAKVSYITNQHAYIHELEQKNALLGSEVDQARVVINDMGNDARSRGDALVRTEKERDAQRSAAAERALEVEHLNALLQERDVSLAATQSQLLQERQAHDSTRALLRQQNEAAAATEAQLRLEQASVTRLSEVLVERSVALEVLQSTAQEQEASLATEKEQAEGLRTTVADALARAEALEVAYSSSQQELEELKEAATALCQEYEEDGAQSGSSLASRLRSLGGRIVERVKNTFLLGIRKTLGVVSTHYIVQLDALATGYVVAEGLDDDAAMAAADQADANVAETAVALATLFADEILPGSGEGDDEVSAERTVEGDGP